MIHASLGFNPPARAAGNDRCEQWGLYLSPPLLRLLGVTVSGQGWENDLPDTGHILHGLPLVVVVLRVVGFRHVKVDGSRRKRPM